MVNWPWLVRKHCHLQWCVTLKEISICTALWTDIYVEPFVATIEKNLQHSANTVGVKCDNSGTQICHFQKLPIHRIFSVILNLAIFNTIFNSHHYSLLCLFNNIYTDLYLYRGVA